MSKKRIMAGMKVNPDTGCWEWQKGIDSGGYARCMVNGKPYAHRNAYRLWKGDIPDGLFVCHTCDVRHCVNPDHLFIGDPCDNSADMVQKGRSAKIPQKLTVEKVIAIRERYAAGETQTALASEYGVSQVMVSKVVRRLMWKHVS